MARAVVDIPFEVNRDSAEKARDYRFGKEVVVEVNGQKMLGTMVGLHYDPFGTSVVYVHIELSARLVNVD